MRQTVRAGTRDIVLLGLALVIIVVAVVAYTKMGPKDAAPSDVFMKFYCPQCKQEYSLSEAEFEKSFDKHEYTIEKDGRTMLFKCKKCGQMAAIRRDLDEGAGAGAPPAPAEKPGKPKGDD